MKINYSIKIQEIRPGTAVRCTSLEEIQKVIQYLNPLALNKFKDSFLDKKWEEVKNSGGMYILFGTDLHIQWNRFRAGFENDFSRFKFISFESTGL